MGIAQIEARLAGTDGRPGTTFDAATLRDIALSNRVFFGGLLREDIRTPCRVPGSVTIDDAAIDLTTACATLTGWEGLASPPSAGYPLFAAIGRRTCREREGQSGSKQGCAVHSKKKK